ncbi:winged helix-turn-helix transcriptional regulator [Enterobacteriaceae bacterium 4M9]|nr:winged helix-turn-helix transcriptional regulator [Enterobacteriaceae bacterium 4M9]
MKTIDDVNESCNDLFLKEVCFNGEQIALRAKEKRLLNVLITASPGCVSRQKIAEDIWDGRFVSDFTINQTINSLRRKINDNDRVLIKTKPKEGYVVDREVAALFTVDEPSSKEPNAEPSREPKAESIPAESPTDEKNMVFVATDNVAKDDTVNIPKKGMRVQKRLLHRVLILLSLLLACVMAGIGAGAIRDFEKIESNMTLYIDGLKFTFRKGEVEYDIDDKTIKCDLLKKVASDGDIIFTDTTLCKRTH